MALDRQQQEQAVTWLRDLFDWDLTKLLLSVVIILSVLPFQWVTDYTMIFFAFFAVEVSGRLFILRADLRRRRLNKVELLLITLDVLATISFLPMEHVFDDAHYLRLVRLSRMMLLLGYWGPIVREIWFIMMKRERRYQIFFVIASVLILTFISAILLNHFKTAGIDLNDDGDLTNDSSFWVMLWWSFLQIQDPGNLLKSAEASMAFFFSVFLTIAGMFIFSFLIGIGASVVEELVALGKERRLGMHRHTVICNTSSYSRVLLEELIAYYAKSFRSPRIVAMGERATRYGYMLEGPSQRIRYRQGQPISEHDLKRVDADRATRVILLGSSDDDQSDAEVISQVLSVRQVNPDCYIFAELQRPDNVHAAITAGVRMSHRDDQEEPSPDDKRTVPILADQLVGLFLANITVFPGVQQLYWELLTSRGDEIYTCLYDYGALSDSDRPTGPLMPFGELLARCQHEHGVILLGYMESSRRDPLGATHALNPGSPRGDNPGPAPVAPVDRLMGFFGVGDNFQRLRKFVESLPDVSATPAPQPLEDLPAVGLCPSTRAISRVVIFGFHPGLEDFCEQLILFSDQPEIYIVVHDAAAIPRAARAFTHRMELAEEPGDNGHRTVTFRRQGERSLSYEVEDADGVGQIRFTAGDWTDEEELLEPPGLDLHLRQADVIFFTYTPGEQDPDARTALGLIKLVRLREQNGIELRPGQRVVCEVQSNEKARLFSRRFAEPESGKGDKCLPVAIVPAERLRNSILAQAVFVPGISNIYRELLSDTGQEICKLLLQPPAEPDARWTFGDVLTTLYQRDKLLLLAVELQGEDEERTRMVVNPGRKDPDYRFRAGDLCGVYAIGDKARLPKAEAPCDGCGMTEDG